MNLVQDEPDRIQQRRQESLIMEVGYRLLEIRVKPSRPTADEQPIPRQASALADESLCNDIEQGTGFPNFCVGAECEIPAVLPHSMPTGLWMEMK